METTLSEAVQIGLTIAFIAVFAWTFYIIYRPFRTEPANGRPKRFVRMLRALGVEQGSLMERRVNLYRPSAMQLCQYCPSEAECDAWFAQKGDAAVPPEFCPNVTIPQLVAAIPHMHAD